MDHVIAPSFLTSFNGVKIISCSRVPQVVAVAHIELVAALRKKQQAREGEGEVEVEEERYRICMRGEVLITRASSSLRYKLSVTALRADNYRTIRVR